MTQAAKTTLADFGYAFTAEGKLRSIDGDEPFNFQISDKHSENQRNYEELGEVITGKFTCRVAKDFCRLIFSDYR
jgi:hypothetical protein